MTGPGKSGPRRFRLVWLAAGCLVLAAASDGAMASSSSPARPHTVAGRGDPASHHGRGVASFYAPQRGCKKTANGEVFNPRLATAASKTLPLPSRVEVTNLENGRKTRVRVNDRGPYVRSRILDVSPAAAKRLGFSDRQVAKVDVRYLGPAPTVAAADQSQHPPGCR
jgi:rare lipoprotein A (peptidoglycan hydrolase)